MNSTTNDVDKRIVQLITRINDWLVQRITRINE